MPVTVKLSRKLCDRFGEDLADELVEWFNSVDATYRAELREINEFNFVRFDAKLEQRVAEMKALVHQTRAEIDANLERRLAEVQSRMLGWSFAFWATTLLAILGSRLL